MPCWPFLALWFALVAGCASDAQPVRCLDLQAKTNPEAPIPLLDRAVEPTLACFVERTPQRFLDAAASDFRAVTHKGEVYIAFSKADQTGNLEGWYWAVLEESGTLGNATKFADDGFVTAMTADEHGLAIGWGDYDVDEEFRSLFLHVDLATGQLSEMTTVIDGNMFQILPLQQGYAILVGDNNEIRYLRVADDGTVEFHTSLGQLYYVKAVAAGQGVAIVFRDDVGCQFALVNNVGEIEGQSVLRETPAFDRGTCQPTDLVVTDNGFLVAVDVGSVTCETRISREFNEEEPVREQHIEIVSVDEQGQRVGAPIPLTGPRGNVREMQARFLAMNDAIGIMWSRGSVIYECGGCIGDDELRFTMLSKQDLAPLTETITMQSPFLAQLAPAVMLKNSDNLLLFIHFVVHAISFPGSASIRCEEANTSLRALVR